VGDYMGIAFFGAAPPFGALSRRRLSPSALASFDCLRTLNFDDRCISGARTRPCVVSPPVKLYAGSTNIAVILYSELSDSLGFLTQNKMYFFFLLKSLIVFLPHHD